MTIKFGNFAIFIVRNFVVIWEAPNIFYFFARERGRGSPRRQGGVGVGFLLKVPGRGGGVLPREGGGGARGCLRGIRGILAGELNIFLGGQNAHQENQAGSPGRTPSMRAASLELWRSLAKFGEPTTPYPRESFSFMLP